MCRAFTFRSKFWMGRTDLCRRRRQGRVQKHDRRPGVHCAVFFPYLDEAARLLNMHE